MRLLLLALCSLAFGNKTCFGLELLFKGTLPAELSIVGKAPSAGQVAIAVFVEGAVEARWAVPAKEPLVIGALARLTVPSYTELLRIEVRSPGRQRSIINVVIKPHDGDRYVVDIGTPSLPALPLPEIKGVSLAISDSLQRYKLILDVANDQQEAFDLKEIALEFESRVAFDFQGVSAGGAIRQYEFKQQLTLSGDGLFEAAVAVGSDPFTRGTTGMIRMSPTNDRVFIDLIIDLTGSRLHANEQSRLEIILPMTFVLVDAAGFVEQYKRLSGRRLAMTSKEVELNTYEGLERAVARLRFANAELGELVKVYQSIK